MAKFIPGPNVSEIRNALGSQVYSRNTFGPYTRDRVSPAQPDTPDKELTQEGMTAAADAWSNVLTEAQRTAWYAFADAMKLRARSPIPGTLNGPATFVKLFLYAYHWSGNFLYDPPNHLNTPLLSTLELAPESTTGAIELSFAPSPVPADTILMLYATPPLNPGVMRPHRWFKPIAMFPEGTTSPQDIWTSYTAAWGTPPPGKKVFVQAALAYPENNLPGGLQRAVTLITGEPEAMLQRTVTISSAELLDLVANPVEVIPAPGAGNYIVLDLISCSYHFNSVAYDITAGGTLGFWLGNTFDKELAALNLALVLDAVADMVGEYNAAPTGPVDTPNKFENKAIFISPDNGLDYEDGNGTLTITMNYTIHPLA